MPSAKAVEFERVATKLGFVRIRQTGAHGHWAHPDGRRVIIPTHGNQEIGPPLFFKIVKQLGIGIEQFKQLK